MKINEIIREGIWDNLKTAGQKVRQGVGTVANKVGQTYQQTRQAQQQRFSQAAAAQNLTPAQLRTQNVGTFVGDVARTIGQAQGGIGGGSMMAKATPTIPNKTIPIGSTVETALGNFKMTAQGWTTETNQPIKDLAMVNKLNAIYYQGNQDQAEPAQQATTSPSGILGPGGKPIQYDAQGKPIVS